MLQDRPLAVPAAGVAAALALAALIDAFGHAGFAGFDLSLLVDLGWRVVSGQRPYVDFPMTQPPAFLAGAAGAYAIWGVRWSAHVWAAAALAVASFGWLTLALRGAGLTAGWSLAAALAVEALGVLPLAYWWHNSLTAVLAAVLFANAAWLVRAPAAPAARASFVAAAATLALAKPGVAGAALVLVGLILVATPGVRLAIFGLAAAAAVLALGMLLALGLDPRDVAASYVAVGRERGRPLHEIFTDGAAHQPGLALAALAASIAPAFGAWLAARRAEARAAAPAVWALAGAAIVVSFYGMFTNYELKLTDMAPLYLGCLLPALLTAEAAPGRVARASAAIATAVAIAAGVVTGYERTRLAAIGDFYEGRPHQAVGAGPFFDRLVTGPRFAAMMAEIEGTLTRAAAELGRPPRVFFGPRLEFCYAAFGLRSPTRLPIWWHPGTSYMPADEPRILAAFVAHDFDLAILLPGDKTGMPPSLDEHLVTRFRLEKRPATWLLRPKAPR